MIIEITHVSGKRTTLNGEQARNAYKFFFLDDRSKGAYPHSLQLDDDLWLKLSNIEKVEKFTHGD